MRAIEIAGFGGPEVLREVVRARPVAGAGSWSGAHSPTNLPLRSTVMRSEIA